MTDKKEEKVYEESNGCLWMWYEKTDFLLSDWDIDWLPTLFDQDDIRFEYNQADQEWSEKSCTIFSAIWAIADLMNYDYPLERIQQVDNKSYLRWRVKGQWWLVKKAVELACDDWNSDEELVKEYWKVAYYYISKYEPEKIAKVIAKNYTIVTWYNGSQKYNNDYRKDAVLDWDKFLPSTYWHAVDVISYKGKRSVKNSYKGRKTTDWKKDCNIYELKHQLNEIDCRQNGCYVITKVAEDNYEELKRLNTFETKVLLVMKTNSELRHLTNDQSYRDELHIANNKHKQKLKDIEAQKAKFS